MRIRVNSNLEFKSVANTKKQYNYLLPTLQIITFDDTLDTGGGIYKDETIIRENLHPLQDPF